MNIHMICLNGDISKKIVNSDIKTTFWIAKTWSYFGMVVILNTDYRCPKVLNNLL